MTGRFPATHSLVVRPLAVAAIALSCTACLTLTEAPLPDNLEDDRVVGVWVKQSSTPEEGPAVLSIARTEDGYIGWHSREAEPHAPLIRFHLARLANGLWAQVEMPEERCQRFIPFGRASRCYATANVSGLPDRLRLSQPRSAHWVRRSLEGEIAASHALVGAGGEGPTLWSLYFAKPMDTVARVLGDGALTAEAFESLAEYARER